MQGAENSEPGKAALCSPFTRELEHPCPEQRWDFPEQAQPAGPRAILTNCLEVLFAFYLLLPGPKTTLSGTILLSNFFSIFINQI